MGGKLHIHLLGDFRLLHDDVPLTDIDTPALQSLLGYLLLHRDAPQARSHLAYLFWPDSTEAQARTNLRKQIYHLRQALPDADRFLHADRNTVQWQTAALYTLDVAEFEAALAAASAAAQAGDLSAQRAALERAISVYGGDLLPSCYDDWVLEERERLRHRYTASLEALVDLLSDQGDYAGAIRQAQRLLRHDPVIESTYRRLMRLYAAAGNRALALRTYHTCATTLQQELEVEPDAVTRHLYRQLLQHDAPATAGVEPVALTSPLIARDDEWAQLQVAWQDAAARRPQMVLLTGEAGIGKTRLAEEFLTGLRRRGVTTGIAHCYSSGGSLPYAPVATWLRGGPLHDSLPTVDDLWLVEIARLLPEILVDRPDLGIPQPLTQEWQRQRLFQALVRPITAHDAVALLLDDAHWCDPETLAWLTYLLRAHEAAQVQLLVVVTIRTSHLPDVTDLARLVDDLSRTGQVTQVELQPLDQEGVATLVARLAGRQVTIEQVQAIYRETVSSQ